MTEQSIYNYDLGTRVRFDVGWPVPARARWLDGIVTEIHDRLVIENFAAVRVERELVVREVLSDGSIMSSATWHFGEQDSSALTLSGSSPSFVPDVLAAKELADL